MDSLPKSAKATLDENSNAAMLPSSAGKVQQSWAGIRLVCVVGMALWAGVFLGCDDDSHGVTEKSSSSPRIQLQVPELSILGIASSPRGYEGTRGGMALHTSSTQRSVASPLKELILKPLVWEVATLAVFQYVAVPILARALIAARRITLRVQWLPVSFWLKCRSLLVRLKLVSPVRRRIRFRRIPHFKASMNTHWIRRFRSTVAKVFRKRSRLSVASEYTNFISEPPQDDSDDEA